MQISKKSQYGMRAMVLLAKNYKTKQLLSTKEIAQAEGVPFDFLEKIILQLKRAELVKGKKGANGGYVLIKNPKKVTALQIVRVLEDTMPVDCSLCGKKRKCMSKNVWTKVDVAINKALKSVKLADLI